MADRAYIPPPDAAPSPNGAPGREFWMDRDGQQFDADFPIVPPAAAVANLSAPNLSRQNISDQLYGGYLALGNSPSVARALADARALLMTS